MLGNFINHPRNKSSANSLDHGVSSGLKLKYQRGECVNMSTPFTPSCLRLTVRGTRLAIFSHRQFAFESQQSAI